MSGFGRRMMLLQLRFSTGLMYNWGSALIINPEDYSCLDQVELSSRHIYPPFCLLSLLLSLLLLQNSSPSVVFPALLLSPALLSFHAGWRFRAFIDFPDSLQNRSVAVVESSSAGTQMSPQLKLAPQLQTAAAPVVN